VTQRNEGGSHQRQFLDSDVLHRRTIANSECKHTAFCFIRETQVWLVPDGLVLSSIGTSDMPMGFGPKNPHNGIAPIWSGGGSFGLLRS
jgi:hypothetical protein